MKKLLLLLFLICIHGMAQTWNYARLDPNYSGLNYMKSSAIDSSGNLYLSGNYEEVYHSTGPRGFFITKIDPSGNILWSDTMHTRAIKINAIDVNQSGELVVAGVCNGIYNFFGSMIGTPAQATGFSATFNSTGVCTSSTMLPYTPYAFKFNSDYSMTICGIATQPFSNLNYSSATSHFIGNFDDFQNANWINDIPIPSPVWTEFNPLITSDADGNAYYANYRQYNIYKCNADTIFNVYTTGDILEICAIDDALYCGLRNNGRLLKYNENLELKWAHNFIAGTDVSSISKSGNSIVLGGSFYDSLVINNISYAHEDSAHADAFALKTDTAGNVESILTSKYPGNGYGYSTMENVHAFSFGNQIYVGGEVEGYHSFGPDTLLAGSYDPHYVFFAKADFGTLQSIGKDNQSGSMIKSYPNPFKDELRIEISGAENNTMHRFELFSDTGIKISQSSFLGNYYNYPGSGLSNGLYFFRVTENNGKRQVSGKLIKE